MPIQGRASASERVASFEVDGLRELDDSVIGERADDVLAELLRARPDVAEASATSEQDHARRSETSRQLGTVICAQVADESRARHAKRCERSELAEEYRAVAHVRRIREVDEGDALDGGEERPKRFMEARSQGLDRFARVHYESRKRMRQRRSLREAAHARVSPRPHRRPR
jgi:hypothetical protein